jgi:two-component system, oxyanion-binding sensor
MTKADTHKSKPSTPSAPAVGSKESRYVRAGFIPLVDASLLIAAVEFGFAAKQGLTLDLVKDVSWANVRDRLAFQQFDVAHMLSPMPVASMLGLGSNPSPTITGFSLGQGGNAITLSTRLFQRMLDTGTITETSSALDNAKALALVLESMRRAQEPSPTLGVTYPFSSHNYEFRYWLAAGGINPDTDVKLVVVPPPLTSDALAAGAIDGFCVGAPWNMVASKRGTGRIVAAKQDIWPSAPEKVLGMRPEWANANQDTIARLIVALDASGQWCDQPENRSVLADALSSERYLGVPAEIIQPVLAGEFNVDAKGNRRIIDHYFRFHGNHANYPRPSQALWIYSQMIRWGQAEYCAEQVAQAASAYRPDIYRQALGLPDSLDAQDMRVEGLDSRDAFIDGFSFDPHQIDQYVQAFPVKATNAQPTGPETGPRRP